MKKIIKAFSVVLALDILTNILYALMLGVTITRQIVLFSIIFSLVVAYTLDKFDVLQK